VSAGDSAWDRAVRAHAIALERFLDCAAAVPPSKWSEPLAPGKWTPAEVVEHLVLAYETVGRELSGGAGMRVVLPGWKRLIARLFYLPRIIAGRGFPKGAKAPRETRPVSVRGTQAEVVSAMRSIASGVERQMLDAHGRAGRRLTHAYFGRMTFEQGMLMQVRHLDHHRAQLDALAARIA
jgi:hypothetical protein